MCLSPVLALQAGWGDLQEQLRRMVADKKAQVGIAVILDGRDTLTVNNDVRYPMMSVFKFHQALAVADACGQRGVSFDTLVHVRPDDLHTDTYSPLRDKYPDGNLSLSVGELLKYTLHLSDNNACDILSGCSEARLLRMSIYAAWACGILPLKSRRTICTAIWRIVTGIGRLR